MKITIKKKESSTTFNKLSRGSLFIQGVLVFCKLDASTAMMIAKNGGSVQKFLPGELVDFVQELEVIM